MIAQFFPSSNRIFGKLGALLPPLRGQGPPRAVAPGVDAHMTADIPIPEAVSNDVRQNDMVLAGPTVLADIDFAETGNCNALLLEGWSHQEPLFIWAVGQSSDILLPDTQGWSDVTLELDVFPCILPPHRTLQRLRLRAGEHDIGGVDVVESSRVTIASPPTLDWGKLRQLTLFHPDGIVPSACTGSSDGRSLSIAVCRMIFRGHRAPAFEAIDACAALFPAEGELSDTNMILQFEGLGGTLQGCEFGLVQRELGAEPLGLLRWSQMNAESLAAGLEADFAGVGSPEQTLLDYFEWPNCREYRTEDRRFLMSMHTWVKEDEKPYDAMFKTVCRRLVILRDKLLEDLTEASKIFVFKMGDHICTPEQLARILAALRRRGPNTLLYVRLADGAHPSGTVEAAQDGLLIGYISQFNEGLDGEVRKPDYETWRTICREAHRLWRTEPRCPPNGIAP